MKQPKEEIKRKLVWSKLIGVRTDYMIDHLRSKIINGLRMLPPR